MTAIEVQCATCLRSQLRWSPEHPNGLRLRSLYAIGWTWDGSTWRCPVCRCREAQELCDMLNEGKASPAAELLDVDKMRAKAGETVTTDGRWLADVVDLPGVMAYGQTEGEAVERAEALAVRVQAERPRKGTLRVALRTVREGLGVTQAEIAERLGIDQAEVSRIERRPHVRYSTLCKYAEALGARCDVAFVFPDGRHLLVQVVGVVGDGKVP